MIVFHFQGFFQCRLATDSAAFDSPRGDGGWTFAFDGEPDLDRVIRFNDPVALRSQAPAIGVLVKNVSIDGLSQAAHPLLDARVDLIDAPKFEGRNHAIAGDGYEPISPMHLSISRAGFSLQRRSRYDVLRPAQRAPYFGRGVVPLSDPIVRGTRLATDADAIQYRRTRLETLMADRANAGDAATRVILDGRIGALQAPPGGALLATLTKQVNYEHPLKDEASVNDPGSLLNATPDDTAPWQVGYWMGCWDADTLTGYVRGELRVPTR